MSSQAMKRHRGNLTSILLSKGSEVNEVTQSCLTLCDAMECSLLGSSIHGIFPGKDTGMSCHFLLQGIFPTQELNPGLPQCRQMLYPLSHQGSSQSQKNAFYMIPATGMVKMFIRYRKAWMNFLAYPTYDILIKENYAVFNKISAYWERWGGRVK